MSAQLDQVTAQTANDPDSLETKEWLEALEAVIENEGPERAHYLMERLVDLARRRGAHIPFSSNTAYVNTIPAHLEQHCPGNHPDTEGPGYRGGGRLRLDRAVRGDRHSRRA